MTIVMALLAGLLSVGFATLTPTRAHAAPGDPIVCTPGVIYTLDGVGDPTGTLYQLTTATGALTPVGAFPSTPTQQINALAIPAGGGSAYALRATATAGQLELMKYTSATNSSAVIATVASPHGMVAGAIDPTTGYFWWAGPSTTTAGVWSLSAYDLSTNTPLGVQFSTPSNNGNNGDLAFDNTGRLFLVTSAGDGTAANNQLRYFDKPFTTGGTMAGVLLTNPAPADRSFNGIAFGADGFLYTMIGGGTVGPRVVYQVNPSTGAVVATRNVTQGGAQNQKATDLGSCASPSSLSLVKDVQSRYLPTDQFRLAITGNGLTRNNTGVTSGSSTGAQLAPSATAGPVLAIPGATYSIAETGSGGTDLGNYVSSYVCVNQTANNAVVASGTTTSGRVTVPQNLATGASVVCTITNTAKTPGIDLEKRVSGITDVNGNGITDLGDQIRWEFDVTNTGSTALSAVSITDDKLTAAGISVTCAPATLAVGASVVCTADAPYTITAADVANGKVVNTAVARGTPPGKPPVETPPSTTSTPLQGYTVTKTVDKVSVTPGGVVTYTVTVTNAGQVAYTDAAPASFSDDLSGVLDDATYNGDVSAGGSVTGNTLKWSGPLAVGASTAVTYSVTVKDPNTGDNVLDNAVTPTGPGGSCATGGDCTTSTPVQSYTVTKVSDSASIIPGGTVKYTVTVTNTGKVDYTDAAPATFTDDLSGVLDDATYNGDVSAGGSVTGNTLTWSGPLAVGATTSVTYTVTVNSPLTGDHTLTNAVVPTGPGGDCDPDGSCVTDTPVQAFTVAKTSSAVTATPGDTVTYTVTVTNVGAVAYTDAAPASFTDDLSKVLDDAAYNDDVSEGGSVTGDTLTWSGALPVGGTTTVTYSVTIDTPVSGDNILTNVVVPTAPGGACDTDGGCTTTTPIRGLRVEKSTTSTKVTPGDVVPYTITITNTGQVAYTDAEPASFTDDLSKVLDDATYNDDAASSSGSGVTYAAPTLAWSGPLAIGDTVTVTYSATVNDPASGDRHLDNTVVTPPGLGGNCPPGSDDPDCVANVPAASYTVVKKVSNTRATVGDVVTFSITVKNTGAVAYTTAEPATFTDDLSSALAIGRYNDDASAGATYSAPVLSWAGALGIGESTTVTYSVTVTKPGTIKNVVVTPPGSGANCPPGSDDPDCDTTTTVALPPPGGGLAHTGFDSAWLGLLALLLGGGGLGAILITRKRRNDQTN